MSQVIALKPPQREDFDLSSAKKFGSLCFLFERGESHPSIWSDEFVDEIRDRLRRINFDPDSDFVLLVGSQVPIIRLVAMLSGEVHWNALAWNAAARSYQSITL